jgi:hypothetical protein
VLIATLVGEADELAPAATRAHAVREGAAARGFTVRVATFVSEDRGGDIVRIAAEQDAALVVVELPDAAGPYETLDGDPAAVLAHAPCDVALLAGGDRRATGDGVLVAFAGHDHDWAAVELGAWLAGNRGLALRLLGTRADPASGRRDASRLLASASLALQRGLGVTAEPVLVAPGAAGIIEATRDAALVVLGLSDRWAQQGLGATRLEVASHAASPVAIVRRGVRPSGLAPPEARTRFTWSAG